MLTYIQWIKQNFSYLIDMRNIVYKNTNDEYHLSMKFMKELSRHVYEKSPKLNSLTKEVKEEHLEALGNFLTYIDKVN